jgi:protein arginine N-methyltransferase 1
VPAPLHWISGHAVNHKHAMTLKPEMILGDPVRIDSIDFLTETRSFLSWTATLVAARKGWLHGLGGWFDCRLGPTVGMTNSPLDAGRIDRSHVFLALQDSIAVQPGDEIRVSLSSRPDADLFVWDVEHLRTGRRQKHSTWEGQVTSRADLTALRPDMVPVLDRTAVARQIVLGYCDGQRSLAQIEAAVLRDHPGLFPTPDAITDFVRICVYRATR